MNIQFEKCEKMKKAITSLDSLTFSKAKEQSRESKAAAYAKEQRKKATHFSENEKFETFSAKKKKLTLITVLLVEVE